LILFVLIFGLCLLTAGNPSRAAPPTPSAWLSKVDAWVLKEASRGQTEFILFLPVQADLSPAADLPTKLAKGRYVYEALTAAAEQTQGPLLATLKARGVAHRSYWVANMIWVRGDAATLAGLAARADVAHVYANPAVKLNEPARSEAIAAASAAAPAAVEWGIAKVNAPSVWAAGYTGQGAVIAGQDTGYQWDHLTLKDKYRGWDGALANHDYNWHDAIHTTGSSCGADSPFPCDDNGHGTHTMGTMVGDDGTGNQIGMAPGAKWIGCRNMNANVGTPATYAECYQWFIAPTRMNGTGADPALAPDVINNSWSCPPSEGCTDPNVLLTVVQNVRAAGIVTVHSAGNSGSACSTVNTAAAIYAESFSVGATNSSDIVASFSSRGPVTIDGSNRLKPDISAPGVSVRSSYRNSSYATLSGTSMAAPHVAGLVALLISAEPAIAGQVGYIEDLIEQSAVRLTLAQTCGGVPGSSIPNNTYGWGRIDALAAYNLLRNPFTVTTSPTAADICAPTQASFSVTFTPKLNSFPDSVTPGVSGVPAGATAAFSPDPVAAPWITTLTIGNTDEAATGAFPLTLSGRAGLAAGSVSAQLQLHRTPPATVSAISSSRTAANQVQLRWGSAAGATGYQVWRAVNDPYFTAGASCAFPAPYACETVTETSYLHASLGDPAQETTYEVRAANACGTAATAPPRAAEFEYALTPGN
jgi:subtilisin family serine protease